MNTASTDRLVEGEYYTIYSTDYTGKQEVFICLGAISNVEEAKVSEFGSTEFNPNYEDMFSEDVKNAVMSTLDENEFTLTATGNEGQESDSQTVWNVSAFVTYHGQHEPEFQLVNLAKPISILLWLGWTWQVIF